MSDSKPTRIAAYRLRVTHRGAEELLSFSTHEALARDIARRYHGGNERHFYRPSVSHGARFSACGTVVEFVLVSIVQVSHSKYGAVSQAIEDRTVFEAFGPSGKALPLGGILDVGNTALEREHAMRSRRLRLRSGNYCGHGPVPGIRKFRGGSGYFRRVATTAEMRLNALVLNEEGEVAARPARSGRNLPNAWDDIYRVRETGWKAQHKGRKAWDRKPRHGKGEPA